MPVLVKDYTWRQSDDVVLIQVPLKGVHHSKVDVFTLDDYIKASFPPFLFEVFLFSPVNKSESKCIKCEEEIVFELKKIERVSWETLEANLTKQEMKDRRFETIERAQKQAEAESKANSEKNTELQRLAVRKQVALDTSRLEAIKQMKEHEKNVAMQELEVWKAEQSDKPEKYCYKDNEGSKSLVDPCSSISVFNDSNKKAKEKRKKKKKVVEMKKPSEFITRLKQQEEKPMPPARSAGSISITFTPRVFPTPSRESQHAEEEEWLKKQVDARRKVGFVAEDLLPEEQDPVWLKEKGDSFFKVQNYLGAVSAYSHAIKLGSRMAALYSNRSAAHLALGNLHKTIEDCSTALELFTPHVAMNAEARTRCHARRGTALCRMGLAKHGVADFEEAVRLQPENQELKEDLAKAIHLLDQASSDSD